MEYINELIKKGTVIFMNKYIVLFLILGLSPVLHAGESMFFNVGLSRYDQLAQYYTAGKIPDQSELIGWRTGRCYTIGHARVNIPRASLLAGVEEKEHGPVFPSDNFKIVWLYEHPSTLPYFFDDMSEQDRNHVQSRINNLYPKMAYPEVDDNALTWKAKFKRDEKKYYVRQLDKILVVKQVALRDMNVNFVPIFAGEAFRYCYYFKKVN